MDRQEFLKKLKKYGEENNIPNISQENAIFLRQLIKQNNTRHLLEIGSANGYSTIQFADEIEKIGGKITSIEFSQLAYEEAQDNFKATGVANIIQHYFGDAREILPLLVDTYDFVFIDGLKKESLNFLKLVWNKTLPGGVVVIDDVIKFRYKMESLYDYIESEKLDYEIIKVDIDDGIMLIKKPSN